MPLLSINELETMSPLFRGKAGNAFAGLLMRILSVDRINELYDRNINYEGPEFTRSVLNDLGIRYEIENMEILDSLPDGPFITISNHPYGSIDGIILVDIFGHLRHDYKVMVNKFLGRIKPLDDNFICVTPTGKERSAPTADSVQGIKDAYRHIRAGHPLGLFPSGAVSDFTLKDMCVRDREWQDPVVRLIRKLNVPIVPVAFPDRNSDFYYSLGLIDWRVRLLRLPSEVFNKKKKVQRVVLGEMITLEEQEMFETTDSFGRYLRSRTYGLINGK